MDSGSQPVVYSHQGNRILEAKQSGVIPDELLAQLAARGQTRAYAKNEQLIAEGEVSDVLFVLVAGQCKVFTQDERGRELVYNVLKPGELFGELLLDGGVRSASVRATTQVECILIDQALARSMIQSFPAFAELLIFKLIERVRHSTQLIRGLALTDVFARTVALLEREAVVEEGTRVIPAALTQQEIANRVGATREMINHVVGNLVADGFLVRDGRRRFSITRPLPRLG